MPKCQRFYFSSFCSVAFLSNSRCLCLVMGCIALGARSLALISEFLFLIVFISFRFLQYRRALFFRSLSPSHSFFCSSIIKQRRYAEYSRDVICQEDLFNIQQYILIETFTEHHDTRTHHRLLLRLKAEQIGCSREENRTLLTRNLSS